MRTINIISQFCFFTGLTLKVFHVHFNAILMLVGLIGMIVSLTFGLIKRNKKDSLLLNFVSLGWLILTFVSVKFLPGQWIVLAIAALLTLIAIIRMPIEQTKKHWFLAFTISIALFFFILPTHKRYQILSINWNYEIETDYITLDKYSWFLYQNGEFSEALEVSNKARNIAYRLNDKSWVELIDKHKMGIEKRNWKKYRN